MDVSFSANTWKHFEIQNLDYKLQSEFYASTHYNLNDFKETSKPPCPIFQVTDSNFLQEKSDLKKQLIKNENISLAIFVTYLYEFLHQVKVQIQKKTSFLENKSKIPSEPLQKPNKQNVDSEIEKQTDRRLVSPQKQEKKIKPEDFEILKNLKLKIYEIDLCRLKNVPEKFLKYYDNNLLKKIIFQYLSKALYNISLIEIMLESNQVLCFALSLVSQSLLFKKQKVSAYNEKRFFYDEAFAFLEHFDNVDDPYLSQTPKSQSLLPSTLETQSKFQISKIKGLQNNIKATNFMNFRLTEKEMKGKSLFLKEEGEGEGKKYLLSILDIKNTSNKKINSPEKLKTKPSSKQSLKKSAVSNKPIQLKSNQKLKQPSPQKSWLKYLGCLRYFFSDNPKS